MNAEQQERINAIRDGLRTIAKASGGIWAKLNERSSRFDRHQANSALSPCEEAQLILAAAESVLADATLALQAAQQVRDQADMYRQSAAIEVQNQCFV